MNGIDGLLLDLDNSLLECQAYYRQAKVRVRDLLAEAGCDVPLPAFRDRFDAVARPLFARYGFSRERFPISLQETARVLLEDSRGHAERDLVDRAYAIGEATLWAPYPLYPGVRTTLAWARGRGLRLAICTKGDPEVQEAKIYRHGLRGAVDHVEIVPAKDPDVWEAAAERIGLEPARATVVGDSLTDDIANAHAAGMVSVWLSDAPIRLPTDGARPDVQPTHRLGSFRELPTLFGEAAIDASCP